jgi:dCMP deaminase
LTIRPTIDEYFMEIASVVAKRSTCLRNQVGAVIVKDKRILSTGYNGAPRNLEHCLDIGCIRQQNNIASGTRHELCRAVHAEQNAIIQAALHGVSIENATVYCTHQPCILCAKMLINSRVEKVVFGTVYPDKEALAFFDKAGVKIEQFTFTPLNRGNNV